VVTISEDGENLVMTASGSFDLSNVSPNSFDRGLGTNAAIAPTYHAYGWETGEGSSDHYNVTFSGLLTGSVSAFPAQLVTTTVPFWFDLDQGQLVFSDAVVSGFVNEMAVFENTSLSDLGMIAGEAVSASWGLGTQDEQITIRVFAQIPEPSITLLLVSGILGLVVRRHRIRSVGTTS
jgi:hypothetical protein